MKKFLAIALALLFASPIAYATLPTLNLTNQYGETSANYVLSSSTFGGAYLPLAGGTMSGAIAMGSHKITGVTDPTASQDAATKNYADSTFLPLAGGTMSGAIAMGAHKITGVTDPTAAQDAATKAYADLFLPLAGGTMSGAIAMGSHKITGVTDPTAAQDAATKAYADTFLPLAGGTLSGALALGAHAITGVANPSSAQDAATKAYVDGKILVFTSAAGSGGSATEAMTITGLLSTDTILSVSQKTPGGNSLPLLGYSTLVNDGLTAIWSADPGAGSVIIVSVKR